MSEPDEYDEILRQETITIAMYKFMKLCRQKDKEIAELKETISFYKQANEKNISILMDGMPKKETP